MLIAIPSALLVGAALGVRFKVLILIPAVAFAFIATVVAGVARGDSASAILIAAVLAGSSVQIGYICGIFGRYGLTMARAGSPHRAPLKAESAR
jgi:hypothetical protein